MTETKAELKAKLVFNLIAIAVALPFALGTFPWNGYVISKLVNWQFPGYGMDLAGGMGIYVLLKLATWTLAVNPKFAHDPKAEPVVNLSVGLFLAYLMPALALGLGYGIHLLR